MMQIVIRILAKIVALVCHLRTRISYPVGDPTKILVDHLTDAQKVPREINRETPDQIKVGVIIPFRNQWPMTNQCLKSLKEQSTSSNALIEIYLVDNDSDDPSIRPHLEEQSNLGIHVIPAPGPFNFSKINNDAATKARNNGCDYLLFLNNDVEFIEDHSLQALIDFYLETSGIGALGCTLSYPDDRIQHLFAAPGVKIVAAHPLRGHRLDIQQIWFQKPRRVPAVTGAVLLVASKIFEKVGGFDENLPTLGQDIDLCLKLQRAGFSNWTLPKVRLVHKEGTSRGQDLDPKQVAYMYKKWGDYLINNPSFSKNLSRWSEKPALSIGEPRYPWTLVIS